MQEFLMTITGGPPTPMHNRGAKTIDGIFVSRPLLPFISGGIWPSGQDSRAIIDFYGLIFWQQSLV